MAQRESKTLSFTPQQALFVRECIESGRYQNTSEVVREGLRLLQEQKELREAKLARLRAEIQIGLDAADAGQLRPVEDFMAELREKQRKRREDAERKSA